MIKKNKQNAVGDFLRHWRSLKRLSQMDLAMDIGISPKHLSFVETGRSVPSREMIFRIAKSLRLPLRQQNALLAAAGFAAEFAEEDFEGSNMFLVRQTLKQMLDKHEPFPAIVLNSSYTILMTNRGFLQFGKYFVGEEIMSKNDNLLRILFAENGLKNYVKDWSFVKKILLTRIWEEILSSQNPALVELYKEISMGNESEESIEFQIESHLPVLPLSFEKSGIRANFFTTITTLGTPLDLTTQEIRIESLFPSDELTKRLFSENQRTSNEFT